jgi:FdhE protein
MPMLAYLQQDGKRFGVCSLCECSWNLPRLFCPHCETTDQKKLRYFFSENEKGQRVSVCTACGHYLKTIDLRHQESEPMALLDDLLTTHLDFWARKKKYKRLAFSDRIF